MTAQQRALQEKGYRFHGAYSWNKAEMNERAKSLRAQGHKATVVWEPGSKLSRSGSGGEWSIYWIESQASKEFQRARDINYKIGRLFEERVAAEARIKEIDAEMKKLRQSF